MKKNYSYLLTTSLFLFSITIAFAQEEEKEKLPFMNMSSYSFSEIQKKAERYFSKEKKKSLKKKPLAKSKEDSAFFSKAPNTEGRENDNAYHAFKRWEWYWKDRINPDGSFHDIASHYEDYLQLQKQEKPFSKSNAKVEAGPTWVNINQTTSSGGYTGMGRAVAVAYHPTNASTFFVGTPIGGLWKTTDNGLTYAPLTDALPYVSAGSIVVNYKKPSILYISVGNSEGWWNWNLGVYKSYDNGTTWNPTGLTWNFTNYEAIEKIIMSPTDTAMLFAATTDGLFKTSNSGATWTRVRTGHHNDVIFKINESIATDGQILFAGTNAGDIYKSIDAGTTWTTIYTSGGNGVKLSVTAADPQTIAAAHYGPKTVIYSRNLGTSFTTTTGAITQNPDVFFVSQQNANTFYYGGVDVFKSTDAATNWNQITHWCCPGAGQTTVHADNHYVGSNPLSPNIIYFGNDGGIYYYNENTGAWTERTNGLIITQYYKIANAQNNNVVMIGGTQDNGGRYRQANGVWRASNGGDAMEQAIDPTNYNYMYSTYVNGQLYRTTNAWAGYTEITPGFSSGTREVGNWVTPYTLDPNNSQTIVAGYKDVWRSTDRGTTWTQISFNLTGGNNLDQVAVTPGNSNIIYASRGTSLWKTTNGGTNWTALTVPNAATNTDPWGVGSITEIIISNTNPNNIWISRSGYNAAVKVYKSTDQGATWTNISAGLPNVPVNCMEYENSTNDGIYIGTDAGIFYRDATYATWQYFGQGMPNTAVTDIKIQYSSGKVRAGTHGRGVWETDLIGLPVSLISFTGEPSKDNKSVNLKWSTAAEINNDYFELERSIDGETFTAITKVKGSGYSASIREYSFNDLNPIYGGNYYRLKQVDLDGASVNSQIILVTTKNELDVTISSNVFQDQFELVATFSAPFVQLDIVDLKGNTVYQKTIATNTTHLLGAQLSRGMYIVKVYSNSENAITKKIVKE